MERSVKALPRLWWGEERGEAAKRISTVLPETGGVLLIQLAAVLQLLSGVLALLDQVKVSANAGAVEKSAKTAAMQARANEKRRGDEKTRIRLHRSPVGMARRQGEGNTRRTGEANLICHNGHTPPS